MTNKHLKQLFPFITLVAAAACNQQPVHTADNYDESIPVEIARATLQEVPELGTFTASVEAETVNQIAPQNPGRIKKIYAEVGDHVKAGQKLAEMDNANLEQARLQLENLKTDLDRMNELYKVGGVAKSVWESKKMSYEVARTAYKNLQENTLLCSPIAGIVTARNYDGGDMFTMGAPIFTVEQIRPVKLMVHISESLFPKIKRGMEVDVTFDMYPREHFKGSITLVYPTIDPRTRTFPVEIQIPNTHERIRPGMFARVTLNYGSNRRVVIPDKAVQKQSGAADTYVYVCRDGQAAFRKVSLGRHINDRYEIIDGLKEGELVAVTGQNRLNNGTPVTITNN
jgi:RND family efflux transporter MFP subunit